MDIYEEYERKNPNKKSILDDMKDMKETFTKLEDSTENSKVIKVAPKGESTTNSSSERPGSSTGRKSNTLSMYQIYFSFLLYSQ